MTLINGLNKMQDTEFREFPKMPRISREMIITEKIDGTNAQIFINKVELDDLSDSNILTIQDGLTLRAGSRTRWIQCGKDKDNYGFAAWAKENTTELFKLGEGRHFGEWWGKGIQRGYNMGEREYLVSLM